MRSITISCGRGRAVVAVVVVTLSLLSGACGNAGTDGSARPGTSTTLASTTTVPEGSFVSEEGRFSLDLPGEPQRLTQQQPAGDVVLDVVLFNVDVGDELAYQVAYVDYPRSLGELDPDGVLRGAAGGAAAAVGGTLASTERLQYRGHPAISFEIRLEGAHIAAHSVLVDRRLYTLQAVAVHPPAPDYERMIETFRLTS